MLDLLTCNLKKTLPLDGHFSLQELAHQRSQAVTFKPLLESRVSVRKPPCEIWTPTQTLIIPD